MRKLGLALSFLLLGLAPAQPQSVGWPPPGGMLGALGVYNLSPPTLTTGQVSMLQLSAAGRLLTDATVTPSGTQNVNLTQILGAAPSLTNPLWVFPATGATFPISGTVTADTELPAAAAAADAAANPTAPFVQGALSVFNGTTWDRQRSAVGTTGIPAYNFEGTKTTYSAAGTVALAAAATDVVIVNGSASKTVRVTRIAVSGLATAATNTIVQLIKRSTANSGGTGANPVGTPHDSTNAAVSAVVIQYTANPTPGSTVGTLRQRLLNFSSTTTLGAEVVWTFGDRNSQAGVLRGTAQGIAINLAGATLAGGTLTYDIEWTEE